MIGAVFALLVAVLAGAPVSWALMGRPRRGYEICALVGFSFAVGILAIVFAMQTFGAVGIGFSILPIFGLALAYSGVFAGLLLRADRKQPCSVQPIADVASWERVVLAVAVLMTTWRMSVAAAETLLRPILGWDAFWAWVPRARVWFEHRAHVVFVEADQWGEAGSYAMKWYFYPSATPLVQVWTALGVGSWDETLVSMAWPALWAAMGLACYGQARRLGAPVALAAIATWMSLSTPTASAHVALAGYADLWVAAIAGFATMAMAEAVLTGRRAAAWVAVFLMVAAANIKSEGIFWPAAALGSLALTKLPLRYVMRVAGGMLGVAILVWLIGGFDLTVPGLGQFLITAERVGFPGLPTMTTVFHNSSAALSQFLVQAEGFHFFWPLVAGLVLWLVTKATRLAKLALLLVYVALVSTAYASVFYFTHAWQYAETGTAVGRLALHLQPSLAFVLLLAVAEARRSN